MKIQFTDSVAGPRFAYRMGDKIDLPDDVAREFIRLKQAVVIKSTVRRGSRKAETAQASGFELR